MDGISLKIHQGTGKLTGKSLCLSCSHAHSYTDSRGDHSICTAARNYVVRGKVNECNLYTDAALPSLWDLRNIAWTLDTDKNTNKVGFSPPKRDED
jgi:hypothetical protein